MAYRILHIIQRYPPALGGSESYFQRLSRYLAGRGHHVTVWTSNAFDLEYFWTSKAKSLPHGLENDQGVLVKRFPLIHFPFQRWILRFLSKFPVRNWQCLTFGHNPISPSLWRETRIAKDFDFVHAACFPYAFPLLAGQKLAQRLQIPFLLTPFLHLGDLNNPFNKVRKGYTHPALANLARKADKIFIQTKSEGLALEQLGVHNSKTVLQGMGVSPNDCTGGNRDRFRSKLGISTTDVVIGHLANLSWDKGSTDLLQAAEQLWEKGSSTRLVLAGPQMPSFKKVLDQSKWKEKVILTGPLSEEDKRDFFSAIDLFALPSRSDSFGIVLLEAWVNGKPCVVYNAGGPGSLVRHGEDGIVVPCDNIQALAQGLENLSLAQSERQKLGESGRTRALTHFSWENKLRIVEDAMDQLALQKQKIR